MPQLTAPILLELFGFSFVALSVLYYFPKKLDMAAYLFAAVCFIPFLIQLAMQPELFTVAALLSHSVFLAVIYILGEHLAEDKRG